MARKQSKSTKPVATKRAKNVVSDQVLKLIPAAVAEGATLVGFEKTHGVKQLWKAFYAEELKQNPALAIKPTAAAVAAARKGTAKKSGLRFQRIAIYSGLTVSKVVKLIEGKDASLLVKYTGRGTKVLGAGARKA